MELDATFKPTQRPRNPTKDRQFKERLCFNCDKPGHLARDCKQPRKNQGRKFQGRNKQLNATWKGRGGYNELAATPSNRRDWEVTPEDLEEYNSSEEEESSGEEGKLTPAGEKELQEFEESAREIAFKEQLPALMADARKRILRRGTTLAVAVPTPPTHWQNTKQDWEVAVRTMRCRPDYPSQDEPRGATYTGKAATDWLYKLMEYEVQDALEQDRPIPDTFHPIEAVRKDQQENLLRAPRKLQQQEGYSGPKEWEVRADFNEPSSEEMEQLARESQTALEQRDVTEIDHPWHNYSLSSDCHNANCATHYDQKVKHGH